VEEKVPSPELFPIHHLDELEYFPGDFVLDGKGNTVKTFSSKPPCDQKKCSV